MHKRNTDHDWEKLAAIDSYFNVWTDERFRKANLTNENKEAFFRSGYDYLAHILQKIRNQFDPTFKPRKSLDFGCGVGRIVVPLAEISESVVGVDVSESMLHEARRNCNARSISNVSFVKSDDDLSLLNGRFDFLHFIIVFQHIPISRGERILKKLLTHAEKGGICVFHFTYVANIALGLKIESWIKNQIPFGRHLFNLARGKKMTAPSMQMNAYDLNQIVRAMQEIGVRNFYAEHTDHGRYLGLLVYFQVPNEA
jgi:ubiquinone/menaquinone biosynthesis C-methylase UbiE